MNSIAERLDKSFLTDRSYKVMFVIGWAGIVIWRIYMLAAYCYHYVDDDQAIMWYGTVHFANGHFPEPCFFGQDYNTMLESLIAVPLYLLGWPLNYALPTVTTMLCILPFAYCSIDAFRRKKYVSAFLVIFLFSVTDWQWNLMTSVPRSFIPGFPFAIIGAGLMCDPESGRTKRGMGAFLSVIGTAMTMSAAALLGIAVLAYILRVKKSWKEYVPVITGGVAGSLLIVFQKSYYHEHADDIITKSEIGFCNIRSFMLSMGKLKDMFRDSFGLGISGVIILLILIVMLSVYLCKTKKWEKLILVIAAFTGALIALSFGWMQVYEEDCILFGITRMILYWVFLILEIIHLFSFEIKDSENSNEDKIDNTNDSLLAGLMLISILAICCKFYSFSKEVHDDQSTIYRSGIITVMSVDELKLQSRALLELAKAAEADVLVTTKYSSVTAYGAAALYYNEPVVFYVPDRDRRDWVYEDLMKQKDNRLLIYSLPVRNDMEISIIDMNGESVPEYFERQYGISRGGELIWGMQG